MSQNQNKRKHPNNYKYPQESQEDEFRKQRQSDHLNRQDQDSSQSPQRGSYESSYYSSTQQNNDNENLNYFEYPNFQETEQQPQYQKQQSDSARNQQQSYQHLSNQNNRRDESFIYYQDQFQIKNIDDNIREDEKCHWFDLFGKCDTSKCEMKHNFTPEFKCTSIAISSYCGQALPDYIQNHLQQNPNFFDCNNKYQINQCHDYTYFGFCERDICKSVHKEVLGKCTSKKMPCKICPKKQREIKEFEIKNVILQPVYYLDQLKNNKIRQNIPFEEKCHWYDLFGKCDENRCKLRHDFQPLFKCSSIEEQKDCMSHLPEYIKLVQAQTKYEIFNCNTPEMYNSIADCIDYRDQGYCKRNICKFQHKEQIDYMQTQPLLVQQFTQRIMNKQQKPENEQTNVSTSQFSKDQIKIKTNKIYKIERNMNQNQQYKGQRLKSELASINSQLSEVRKQNRLDLMFIVECSQQMEQLISLISSKIFIIVDKVKEKNRAFSCRLSFIGYGQSDKPVQVFDFSQKMGQFSSFVKSVSTNSKTGLPQDMISGLKKGLNQEFSGEVGLICLIYSSPAGEQKEEGRTILIEDHIREYAETNQFFAQILIKDESSNTESVERTYNSINKEFQSKYHNCQFNLHDSNLNELITERISLLCHKSVKNQLENNPLTTQNLSCELSQGHTINAEVLNSYILDQKSVIDWRNPLFLNKSTTFNYKIQLNKKFQKGSHRKSYFGRDLKSNTTYIIKFDQMIYSETEKNQTALKEIQKAQVVSSFLIDQFRKLVFPYVNNIGSIPLFFKSIMAEQGNNYCYIQNDFRNLETYAKSEQALQAEYKQLIECLPHFIYQYTEGQLMITNIKGTLPVIYDVHLHSSINEGYDSTDLGEIGIARYFSYHECNSFCKHLKLIEPFQSYKIQNTYDYYNEVYNSSSKALEEIMLTNNSLLKYKEQRFYCGKCQKFNLKNCSQNLSLYKFLNSNCLKCCE